MLACFGNIFSDMTMENEHPLSIRVFISIFSLLIIMDKLHFGKPVFKFVMQYSQSEESWNSSKSFS